MIKEKDMHGGAGGVKVEGAGDEVKKWSEVELSNFTLRLSTEV